MGVACKMPVTHLECGHCHRRDFATPEDLRTHVREDCPQNPHTLTSEPQETRTCRDCGEVRLRKNLTPTPEGYLVCPSCRAVVEAYTGIDLTDPSAYVLRLRTNRSNHHTVHLPSDDSPVHPRCTPPQIDAPTYQPIARKHVPDHYHVCRNCQPNTTTTHSKTTPESERETGAASTRVWFGQDADAYHADLGGIPACPEVLPFVDEHTLADAREHDKRPCGSCEPPQYPPRQAESTANRGDHA